jgi:hypothetical protein
MKVEIISGNEAGVTKDLPQVEAEVAISTGYAKPVYEAVPNVSNEDAALPSAADLDAVAAEADIKAKLEEDATQPEAAAAEADIKAAPAGETDAPATS